MAVKKVQNKADLEASRSKHQLQPRLAELIKLVNTLESNRSLLPIEAIWKSEMEKRGESAELQEYASVYAKDNALAICLQDLPKELKEFVSSIPAQFSENLIDSRNYAVWRYRSLRAALLALRAIANLNRYNVGNISAITNYLEGYGAASTFTVDEEKRACELKSLLAEAIIGVEVDRIRECEICQRIFWALRSDQWTCSKAHAHVLRNRRARANWKKSGELYMRARREKKAQTKTKKGR
jgi:hypothetical protein